MQDLGSQRSREVKGNSKMKVKGHPGLQVYMGHRRDLRDWSKVGVLAEIPLEVMDNAPVGSEYLTTKKWTVINDKTILMEL